MEKFFNEINKYVISILLFLGGFGFLAKYLSGDALESQPVSMLLAFTRQRSRGHGRLQRSQQRP